MLFVRHILSLTLVSFVLLGCSGGDGGFHSPTGDGQYGEQPSGQTPGGGQAPGDGGTVVIIKDPPLTEDDELASARWEAGKPEAREWTKFTFKAIDEHGKELLKVEPADVEEFCPNFKKLNKNKRKNFWIYLLSSIAQFESNFNPALTDRKSVV